MIQPPVPFSRVTGTVKSPEIHMEGKCVNRDRGSDLLITELQIGHQHSLCA
jgi:hypothetical protein